MSWVNDLASALGIPVGVVLLAGAIYAACVEAEKDARPAALSEIASMLKDLSWAQSVSPANVIGRLFNSTFGVRQLSWKCVRRSMVATVIFCFGFFSIWQAAGFVRGEVIVDFAERYPGFSLGEWVFVGFFADYLALGKSRVLVRRIEKHTYGLKKVVLFIGIDIAASLLISLVLFLSYFVTIFLFELRMNPSIAIQTETEVQAMNGPIAQAVSLSRLYFLMFMPETGKIFFCSTLLTSIWLIQIFLATIVVKLFAPLQRGASWLFDIDAHPLRAVGKVAGGLVVVGGLVWSVAKAVI